MFKSLSIRAQIGLSGLLTLLLTAALSGVSLSSIAAFSREADLTHVLVQALNNHQTADMMHDALRADALRALVASETTVTAEEQRAVLDEFDEHRQNFWAALESNAALPLPPDFKGRIERLRPTLKAYIDATEVLVRAAFVDRPRAMALRGAQQRAFSELEVPMGELSELFERACDQERAHAISLGATARTRMLSMSVVGSLLTLAAAVLLARSVAVPVSRLQHRLEEIAGGDADLSVRLEVEREDELGSVAASFNRFVGTLQELLDRIKGVSRDVAGTSQQLAESSGEIASRTQSQAAALEQTSASVHRFSESLNDTAARCRDALSSAGEASESAEAGRRVVQQLGKRMQDILKNAGKIQEIVSVVDEIAIQTNLLALNATVEAARAGEQGRGFAVVAGEVRNLALRCADSAREIRGLLRSSAATVESGAEEANASGATINEMVMRVKQVTGILQEIAQATSDQAAAVQEVRSAVSEMDQATQQSASLNQEGSDAAQGLAEQAQRLSVLANRFRTKPATPRERSALVNGSSARKPSLRPIGPAPTAVER